MVEVIVEKLKEDIKNITCVEELSNLKETISKIIDIQTTEVINSQESVIQIRYSKVYGGLIVEKGSKERYLVKGYLSECSILEAVVCDLKSKYTYNKILDELRTKYNPYIVQA